MYCFLNTYLNNILLFIQIPENECELACTGVRRLEFDPKKEYGYHFQWWVDYIKGTIDFIKVPVEDGFKCSHNGVRNRFYFQGVKYFERRHL